MALRWFQRKRTFASQDRPTFGGDLHAAVRLNLKSIVKTYGMITVLTELHLEIAEGEFVAIVGRSGCGKSTLLRLAAGLERPDSGDITINGRPVKTLAGDVRVMFQEPRLLPWKTVLDNVGVGLAGNWRDAACRALSQVGLADRATAWPSVLSGGQRQRVALARALVSHPRLLLLDEPLAALDALTRIEMQHLIEHLWLARRFTALLVTHDVAEAIALADRVVLLAQGKVTLDLPVSLPRPRQRGQAQFASLAGEVLHRVLDHADEPDRTRFAVDSNDGTPLPWRRAGVGLRHTVKPEGSP